MTKNIARDGADKKLTPPATHSGMTHTANVGGVNVTARGVSRTESAEMLGAPTHRTDGTNPTPAKQLSEPAVNPGMTRRAVHPHGAPVARAHPSNFARDVETGKTIIANGVQPVVSK